ncbi:MAG: helix-turn-helix domain-containing protein [Euzebyales bacterium]|nr:helix-turn-helix domain-containing protein [Euzebyales bacterium]
MADEEFPQVLDAAQVAQLLGLSLDHVRKLSREGVLPAKRIPGGRVFRYFQDDVLDWLRAQDVRPQDARPQDARPQDVEARRTEPVDHHGR